MPRPPPLSRLPSHLAGSVPASRFRARSSQSVGAHRASFFASSPEGWYRKTRKVARLKSVLSLNASIFLAIAGLRRTRGVSASCLKCRVSRARRYQKTCRSKSARRLSVPSCACIASSPSCLIWGPLVYQPQQKLALGGLLRFFESGRARRPLLGCRCFLACGLLPLTWHASPCPPWPSRSLSSSKVMGPAALVAVRGLPPLFFCPTALSRALSSLVFFCCPMPC